MKSPRKIYAALCVFALMIGVVITLILLPGKEPVSAQMNAVNSKTVKVMTVDRKDSNPFVVYPGVVQAHRKVNLAFQVSGPIIENDIKEGGIIRKGSLIARIDPRNYEYNLQGAKARYEKAKTDYNRMAELFEQDVVTKNECELAKTQMDMTEAQYKSASKALDDTRLVAPFTGVVCRRYVENYQNVMATAPVVCLQDVNDLDVIIDVPEANIADFINESGRFVAVLQNGAGEEMTVKMREYVAEANDKTQTYTVKLCLRVPEDITVLPGMSATIRHYEDNQGKTECIIPVTAVVSGENDSEYVWVVDCNSNVVNRRAVIVDGFGNGHLRVVEGLESGETIVTAGASLLSENAVVRVIN